MKPTKNYDKVYCAGCMDYIIPKAIYLHPREMVEEVIGYKDIYDDDWVIIDKQEEVVESIIYIQCTELLECPNPKCRKVFTRKYTKGGIIRDYEIIPSDKKWYKQVRQDLVKAIPHRKSVALYKEIISAFNSLMNYSCGFLLGAIIESICFAEGIKTDLKNETGKTIISLGWQISRLVRSGKLDSKFQKMVVEVKDLRNDVTHEIVIPTTAELIKSIEVIEAVLEEMYVVNYDATIQKRNEIKRQKMEEEITEMAVKRKERIR